MTIDNSGAMIFRQAKYMSPNAMANANAQQRGVQKQQLLAAQKVTQTRKKVTEATIGHLRSSVSEIDSMGLIPALSDVRKIASAIKFLALSQLGQHQSALEALTADDNAITAALTEMDSPITKATRGGVVIPG